MADSKNNLMIIFIYFIYIIVFKMCAYVLYTGRNGYFKDGLNLPPKTVVEIPDNLVNQAKSIRGVLIVSLPVKQELKKQKILENDST
jgi:hypothetical protein